MNETPILPESNFGRVLMRLAMRSNTIVEIGCGNGEGSTVCLANGLVRPEQRMFSVESNPEMFRKACYLYCDERLKFLCGTVLTPKECALDKKALYGQSRIDKLPSGRIQECAAEMWASVNLPYVGDQIPGEIDLLLLDGGEFASRFEFLKLYKRCQIAKSILLRFNSHTPLIDAGVVFDFIFAYPTYDENGEPRGNAISKNGVKALGLCRIVGLKDRAMGRGDVEILIDYPWWEDASDEERTALLDHELHHAQVKTKNDVVLRDDLHRPLIKLRKHDVEIGWFDIVALRHSQHSMERLAAKKLYDESGQLYWPDLAGPPDPQVEREACISPSEAKMAGNLTAAQSVTITAGKTSVTIGPREAQMLRKATAAMHAAETA